MTTKETRIFASMIDHRHKRAKRRKLPPDPDGLFRRAARRGKKVIAMYERLNPDAEGHFVSNIVLDLICLSDRDPELGNVDEECVFALRNYQQFLAENLFEVGLCDDLETARDAAGRMMLSRATK